jgi:hypothetical protein
LSLHSPALQKGDSYVEAVDDGTSTGLKFKYTAKGDSKELTIQGRAANAPLQRDNGDFAVPECRLITYRFNGSDFDTLNEVSNGCKLSNKTLFMVIEHHLRFKKK